MRIKKFTALFSAVILMFSCFAVSASCASYAPTAKLTGTKANDGDTVFSFDLSSDQFIIDNEAKRRAVLAEMEKKGYSGADIPHAIRFPLELTVKCETEYGDIGYAKLLDVEETSAEVSLIKDIMPSFVNKDGSIDDRLLQGFSFTLSVCYTHFKGSERDEITAYGESEKTESYSTPELYYIGYVLPSGAVNSAKNISFGYAPLENDIKLDAPSRKGYTFTGWTLPDDSSIGTVPAGTKKIILTSNWDDRHYAIRYILTTADGYNFMRVDNSANPTSYAPGEGASVTSPVVPNGWRFMGWKTDDGTVVTKIPKGTTGDVILYASWLTEDEYIDKIIADYHWCDVDSDGKVTVDDARAVLRAAVGLEALPKGTLKRVDFAGQGKADITQARYVLRVAVKLDTIREILEAYNIDPEERR